MTKIEKGPEGPEEQKIENLSQLRDLLKKEFGDMSYRLFLHPFLRQMSDCKYGESSMINVDPEKERELENMALENAKITPEIIEKLNEIIKARVEIFESDLEHVDKLKKNVRQEIEEILSNFRNKEIIMNEERIIIKKS